MGCDAATEGPSAPAGAVPVAYRLGADEAPSSGWRHSPERGCMGDVPAMTDLSRRAMRTGCSTETHMQCTSSMRPCQGKGQGSWPERRLRQQRLGVKSSLAWCAQNSARQKWVAIPRYRSSSTIDVLCPRNASPGMPLRECLRLPVVGGSSRVRGGPRGCIAGG